MTEVLSRLKAALADRYTIECEQGSGDIEALYLGTRLK